MTIAFGPALMVYIIVGLIWGIAAGAEYSMYRNRRDARLFLVAPIWPLVVLFWVLRLVLRALVDAFRRD